MELPSRPLLSLSAVVAHFISPLNLIFRGWNGLFVSLVGWAATDSSLTTHHNWPFISPSLYFPNEIVSPDLQVKSLYLGERDLLLVSLHFLSHWKFLIFILIKFLTSKISNLNCQRSIPPSGARTLTVCINSCFFHGGKLNLPQTMHQNEWL